MTSTIVFEENGKIGEYVGGYKDWLRQGHTLTETDKPPAEAEAEKRRRAAERQSGRKPAKLSYKHQRELDGLPDEIDALEARVTELQTRIAAPTSMTESQAR